jgi:hypothetical protein
MQNTFWGEDDIFDLQRMPGQKRATHTTAYPQPDNFAYIVFMDGPIIHTDDHPFCPDWSCPCHEDDHEAIARVAHWVEDGLLTPQEATQYILGRTF